MAEICSKYEHEGDDLLKDMDNEIEATDYENLDGDMIVCFKIFF